MVLSIHAARCLGLGFESNPVLVDALFDGRRRKLVLFANRNGFYYVLDGETGEFLLGKAYARQTWARGAGPSRPSDRQA